MLSGDGIMILGNKPRRGRGEQPCVCIGAQAAQAMRGEVFVPFPAHCGWPGQWSTFFYLS